MKPCAINHKVGAVAGWSDFLNPSQWSCRLPRPTGFHVLDAVGQLWEEGEDWEKLKC